MKEEYLSGEELSELISDIESGGLLEAPGHMKREILERQRQRERQIRRKLFLYSLEVCAAGAAAIFFIALSTFLLSASPRQPGPGRRTAGVERQLKSIGEDSGRLTAGVREFTDGLVNY
ncbi:hypothetical protein [Lachnoclostridium sp. Marseille-P6806]|uniref:hypothetical protein n=1 Tax=Lachnoclostridium sp. Marseille-P6806 TaxID=2364793 RepID=UPI00102FE11D|nr:hypothetical protein [Lachnoclostridium sp. Marseille-P6806]